MSGIWGAGEVGGLGLGAELGFGVQCWGFEAQGRRGMQCCVQTWDLGCRGGLGCKHRNWGSGGNLGCRGRSGVQTRVAKGDLGYRKKSGVQGEIWGCRPRTWGSEVDLGCSGRFGIWEAIWGCRGRFWAHTWGCRCPSHSRGRAVPRGKSGPSPGGLQLRSFSPVTSKHAPFSTSLFAGNVEIFPPKNLIPPAWDVDDARGCPHQGGPP